MAGSFWQRVGNLFTSETAGVGGNGSAVTLEAADDLGASDPTGPPGALTWWRRRQDRQGQTREVALRLVALADAMQEHFRRQDARAAELNGALDRVGGVLGQMAETQRAQGECLRTIAEHAAATGRQSANLSDTLARIPDSLLTQAEAIRTVAVQLDLAQETDTQLMHSLQQFGRAVDALGASGSAQVNTLQSLGSAQQHQHEAFVVLARDQGRRFVLIISIVAVLTLASLVALFLTLAARLSP